MWATHLIDEIEPGDRLIVIDRGQIKASGEAKAVMASAGAASLAEAFDKLTAQSPELAT